MRIKKALSFFIPILAIVLIYGVLRVRAFTQLYSFDSPVGVQATGTPLFVPGQDDDLLYGVTYAGGDTDLGVIYSYNLRTQDYTVLHSFDGTNGSHPVGKLVLRGTTLYGLTEFGGTNDEGTIFSFDMTSSTFALLYEFSAIQDGAHPKGSLTLVDDMLYGLTSDGGDKNDGTLFSFFVNDFSYTKIYVYGVDAASGVNPTGTLLYNPTNKTLYGTTPSGGTNGVGVLFKYVLPTKDNPGAYTKLENFGEHEHISSNTPGDLVLAQDPSDPQTYKMYGFTATGGQNNAGQVFSINQSDETNIVSDIPSTDKSEGRGPLSSIGSIIYGLSQSGGPGGVGYLFMYDLSSLGYGVGDFFLDNGPRTPLGGLEYTNGTFYGYTTKGGDNDHGVIFSVPVPDIEPDTISFNSQIGVGTNQDITSDPVNIQGINTKLAVSLASCTTSCSVTNSNKDSRIVENGDTLSLTVHSPSSCGQAANAGVTIGTQTYYFTITTSSCPSGGGDTTPPSLSKVTGIASYTSDTTPDFTFNSSEAGTILYSGDCSASTTNATSGDNTVTFSALTEGAHSNCGIRVRDGANNTSSTLSVGTFTIDTTAPSVTFSMPASSTSLTVPLTISASDTNGATGYLVRTTNTVPSAADIGSLAAPTSYTFSTYGAKTLYVWARDEAGNVSSSKSANTTITQPTPPPDNTASSDTQPSSSSASSGATSEAIQENKEKLAALQTQQDIPPEVPTTPVSVVTEIPKKVVTFPKITAPAVTLLDSPVKQKIQRSFTPAQVEVIEVSIKSIIAAVTTLGGAVVLVSVLFLNPLARPEFILIPIRLWSMLLIALGLRKRPTPWGVVYDSVTKQPLDPVRVSLIDMDGKVVETTITDQSGRYGFSAPKGIYKVQLQKTNYIFPSHVIADSSMRDELYEKPYFGDYIPYDPEAPIAKNIPVDPVDFDTAAFAKKQGDLSLHYSRREYYADQVFKTMFRTTFLIVAVSLIVYPEKYNVIIFFLYIAAFVLRRKFRMQKQMGRVYDLYGKPLRHVTIQVYSAIDNSFVKSVKTNASGRYYLHLPKGLYYIRIERLSSDGIYTPIYSSPELMVRYGTFNKVFNIAYS